MEISNRACEKLTHATALWITTYFLKQNWFVLVRRYIAGKSIRRQITKKKVENHNSKGRVEVVYESEV